MIALPAGYALIDLESVDTPRGNLYCSLLLRPEQPLETVMQLGFVAALALYDSLSARAPSGVSIACKWPNDVLVSGRKCAGILMETAGGSSALPPDWLVLGFGVNVAQGPSQSEFPATSLMESGFGVVPVQTLLADVLGHFERWRRLWQKRGFAAVRTAWLAAAYGQGEAIVVRLHEETLYGTFADLDGDGALLVDVAAGRRRVTAGDVFFAGS